MIIEILMVNVDYIINQMKFAPACGLLPWLCLMGLFQVISAYDYYDIDHTVNCNLIHNDWTLTENLSYLW